MSILKNKRIYILIFSSMAVTTLFFSSAKASEKIHDMSLSPEQSLRQKDITHHSQGDTGFDPSVAIDPSMARQMQDLRARDGVGGGRNIGNAGASGAIGARVIPLPPVHRAMGTGMAQQNYMSGFCSAPTVKPCDGVQKQQACERFKKATVDMQQLLDRAVACEVNSGNGVQSDCDGLDAGRLDLLKQYWQDEDMSYTVLFLPDMVINSNCKI